jgi:hypothetical protein
MVSEMDYRDCLRFYEGMKILDDMESERDMRKIDRIFEELERGF